MNEASVGDHGAMIGNSEMWLWPHCVAPSGQGLTNLKIHTKCLNQKTIFVRFPNKESVGDHRHMIGALLPTSATIKNRQRETPPLDDP